MSQETISDERFTVRSSHMASLPMILIAFLAAGIFRYISYDAPWYGPTLHLPFNIPVTLPIALLLFLVIAGHAIVLQMDRTYEITPHHIRATSGLVSLKRVHVEIPYEDLLGVRSSQNILERVLGIGSVSAWTAIADKPEVVMKSVDNPDELARFISDKIDKVKIQQKASAQA